MSTGLTKNQSARRGKSAAMSAPSDLACLVREIRARTGLTQEKFAARLGVTFPTINRWENGRAQPSPLAVQQIWSLVREIENENGGDLGVRLGAIFQR